jgi:hypothetical protein
MNGWISPLLGVRFDCSGSALVVYGPDGQRFLTYQEMAQERDRATRERDRATQERDEVLLERDRLELERAQLAQERDLERQEVQRMAPSYVHWASSRPRSATRLPAILFHFETRRFSNK